MVYADENLFTCSQDTQEKIKEKIKEHKLNRVVVASCSPKTHAPMFMETLEACGLNPYLFEMANIRNQDSWVHSGDQRRGHPQGQGPGAHVGRPCRHPQDAARPRRCRSTSRPS